MSILQNISSIMNVDFMKKSYLYFIARLKNTFCNNEFKKYFFFIYLVYFIGILGLLIADVYYVDDLGRSVFGYTGHTRFSRYGSEYLSKIFHMQTNGVITDISPISQLIAIGILSLGSIFLVKAINKKLAYFTLLASVPLGLSPWFLENLSYKFDAPYMALGMLASIFPFIFYRNKFIFIIISAFGVLLTFNTYQSFSGVYLFLSLFFILNTILENKNIKDVLKFAFAACFSYLIAALIYKYCFVVVREDYVSTTISASNIFNIFFQNTAQYVNTLVSDTKGSLLVYFFIFTLIFFFYKTLSKIKINMLIGIFFVIVFLFIGFFISHGLYLLLERSSFSPRAISGIGVFTATLLVFSVSIKSKIIILLNRFFVLLFSYYLIIIAATYANALQQQQKFHDYRLNLLMSDLTQMIPYGEESYAVYIGGGSIDMALVAKNSIKYMPLINRLLFQNLKPSWAWSSVYPFYHFNIYASLNQCYADGDLPIAEKITRFHHIRAYRNNCFEVFIKQ